MFDLFTLDPGGQVAQGRVRGKFVGLGLPQEQQSQTVAAGGFLAGAGAGKGKVGQENGRFARILAAVGVDAPQGCAVLVQGNPPVRFCQAPAGAEGKLVRCQTQYLFCGPIHSFQNQTSEGCGLHISSQSVLITQKGGNGCSRFLASTLLDAKIG